MRNNLNSFFFLLWFSNRINFFLIDELQFVLSWCWQKSIPLEIHRWVSLAINSSYFCLSLHDCWLIHTFNISVWGALFQNFFKDVWFLVILFLSISHSSNNISVILRPNIFTLKLEVILLFYDVYNSFLKWGKHSFQYLFLISL